MTERVETNPEMSFPSDIPNINKVTTGADINRRGSKRTGLVLVGLTGAAAVGLSVISAPFVLPAFRKFCLPYIPATTNQVQNVLRALHGKKGSLLDLGSGDGRIVIAAAKNGFQAHGIELNSLLVLYSKVAARVANVSSQATFKKMDLWGSKLADYDNVVIFGVEQMMEELGKKMEVELKAGCSVAACRFPLPGWTPIKTVGEGVDMVWLYEIPLSVTPTNSPGG